MVFKAAADEHDTHMRILAITHKDSPLKRGSCIFWLTMPISCSTSRWMVRHVFTGFPMRSRAVHMLISFVGLRRALSSGVNSRSCCSISCSRTLALKTWKQIFKIKKKYERQIKTPVHLWVIVDSHSCNSIMGQDDYKKL